LYTGASGKFNHRGQMQAMFPDVELPREMVVDYFADIEHTQLMESDREAIIAAIAKQFSVAW
jgi:hypothetical protein